ncbi:MAG: LCP family protein [Solobacterium sp.]|nr:LCP family protein [Solobacterium sp.]
MNAKRRKKRKLKKGAKLLSVLLVFLLVLLSAAVGVHLYLGTILNRMNKTETMSASTANIVEEVQQKTANTHVFNFLLFGADRNSIEEFSAMERADATKIVSLDMRNKTVKIASLQRDTMVWIPDPVTDYSKLNHAYWWGGPDLAVRTVNMNFDMNITKYVTFSMAGVEAIVDEIGGVDIYLTRAESTYFQDGMIKNTNYVEGTFHLNGKEALAYARLREIDNDYNRMNRQTNLIRTIITKLSGSSVSEILSVINAVMPYIETNFTNFEIERWLTRILSYDLRNIETQDVPMDDGKAIRASIEYNGYSPCYVLRDYEKVIQDLYAFLYGMTDYEISSQAKEVQKKLYEKFGGEPDLEAS